jgi:hypothetical protein
VTLIAVSIAGGLEGESPPQLVSSDTTTTGMMQRRTWSLENDDVIANMEYVSGLVCRRRFGTAPGGTMRAASLQNQFRARWVTLSAIFEGARLIHNRLHADASASNIQTSLVDPTTGEHDD